jgi:hypothetical protein
MWRKKICLSALVFSAVYTGNFPCENFDRVALRVLHVLPRIGLLSRLRRAIAL